ncbi:unnamed protein product [Prorocentrum cordatum]|uniref:RRM domain-containing protein n=1 Tax=Prorocentrum cordatum TaxID=2364126 RepID=A0ABN9PGT7_9DINO|nr:unnamed protein product [Polarella glacialis]
MSQASEVRTIATIKNTFVEFVDEDDSPAAGGAMVRASSCPCIRAHCAALDDDGAYSEDDSSACPRLSSLGSWADATDDAIEAEEEDGSSCCASADLMPWSRSVSPGEGATEEKPLGTGPALAQALAGGRTPLSSKASAFSAFVPTPLSSRASAFVPGLGVCEQPGCSSVQASALGSTHAPIDLRATTVLMRNLPPDLTRAALIKEMKRKGFAGRYGVVHLPLEGRSNRSLGYAYVNLVTLWRNGSSPTPSTASRTGPSRGPRAAPLPGARRRAPPRRRLAARRRRRRRPSSRAPPASGPRAGAGGREASCAGFDRGPRRTREEDRVSFWRSAWSYCVGA